MFFEEGECVSFLTRCIKLCWRIDSSIFYRLHPLCLQIEKKTGWVDASIIGLILAIVIGLGFAYERGLESGALVGGALISAIYNFRQVHQMMLKKGITFEDYVVYVYRVSLSGMLSRVFALGISVPGVIISNVWSSAFVPILMYLLICYPLGLDQDEKDFV